MKALWGREKQFSILSILQRVTPFYIDTKTMCGASGEFLDKYSLVRSFPASEGEVQMARGKLPLDLIWNCFCTELHILLDAL